MKNVAALLIVASIFGTLLVAYKTPFSYCDTSTTYKIGSIDSRFNLSKAQAEMDIEKAVNILDSESPKQLFEYDSENGEVTVNFVYDQRTALMGNIENQTSQITNIDTLLQGKVNKYESDVNDFLQRLEKFDETVETYNNSKETSQEVYDELIKNQRELQAEGERLNRRASELNLETNNFNSSVNQLNQNVSEFNDALSEKPEEGLYDAENKTITIYFVNSKPELLHTLAHEFGHALGMDHLQNNKAIMYPESSEYVTLTQEDENELERVCKSFPLLTHWIYEVVPAYINKNSKSLHFNLIKY